MQKKLTIQLDEQKHSQFKAKAAAAGLSMRDVLNAAIDDYLAGRFKPTKKGVKKST